MVDIFYLINLITKMPVLRFLRKFFDRNTITQLGRWEHRVGEEKKYLRATRSNMDHCGDVSCGFPQNHTKKKIDKVSKTTDKLKKL